MKRLLQISALTLTLAGGYVATAAVAGPGAPADAQTMVDRLTEKLGLDEGTAQDVASTLLTVRKPILAACRITPVHAIRQRDGLTI